MLSNYYFSRLENFSMNEQVQAFNNDQIKSLAHDIVKILSTCSDVDTYEKFISEFRKITSLRQYRKKPTNVTNKNDGNFGVTPICGEEIHATKNEDGTYKVVIKTTATSEGILGKYLKNVTETDCELEVPRANVNIEALVSKPSDKCMFIINIPNDDSN